MRPRIIIAGLILIQPFWLNCQTLDSLPLRRIGIRTSVIEYLPTLNLNTGNINLGLETYLNRRNSIYINVGLIRFYGQKPDLLFIPSISTRGTKIQFEIKHFIGQHQPNRKISNYFSVQIIGQTTETIRQETVKDNIDSIPYPNFIHYRQNFYNVSRNLTKANLKFGAQLIKSSGITIDASVGLGGQYISSTSPGESGFDGSADIPWNKRFNRGSGIYPSLICQIHAGWTW